MPAGTTFGGTWGGPNGPARQTIRVMEARGTEFEWEWRIHDYARHWIFKGTIDAEVSGGLAFSGKFSELITNEKEVHDLINDNRVRGVVTRNGLSITGIWKWRSRNQTVKFDADRVDVTLERDIVNGDFQKGLSGWIAEGGAKNFRVFTQKNGPKALTTHGSLQEADTGRLFQDFLVPTDASELTFLLHGGGHDSTWVALRQGGMFHQVVSAKNSNIPFQVRWNLESLRGETVTLEIVDNRTVPWYGFIGAQEFMITRTPAATVESAATAGRIPVGTVYSGRWNNVLPGKGSVDGGESACEIVVTRRFGDKLEGEWRLKEWGGRLTFIGDLTANPNGEIVFRSTEALFSANHPNKGRTTVTATFSPDGTSIRGVAIYRPIYRSDRSEFEAKLNTKQEP